MTKYWALIIASRPHVFSIGEHENVEQAEAFISVWCDQKNEENAKKFGENLQTDMEDIKLITYDLAYIMDDEDMRQLTGEVHRPRRIARKKREVAVETPVTHGNENVQGAAGELPTGAIDPIPNGVHWTPE
jgi:hypothetical protein